MSHARVEEVSDSDLSDPEEMDISDFEPRHFMAPASIPSTTSRAPPQQQQRPQIPADLAAQFAQPPQPNAAEQAAQAARSKKWQCLYPIYFDKNRSRAEGRRVGKDRAVANPLAREIIDALQVQAPELEIVFEPGKMHPKDWANPGRVRVLVKKDGKAVAPQEAKNKHHLYNLVSDYLLLHPTTADSPLRLRISGMPAPKGAPPGPAIPRGWKMNTVLPLHSPAVTGGGVSENFLKEMMAEMGGGDPSSGPASGSEGKKKKEKKKK